MACPAVPWRWLEPVGNGGSRQMAVQDRTRLTDPLRKTSDFMSDVFALRHTVHERGYLYKYHNSFKNTRYHKIQIPLLSH